MVAEEAVHKVECSWCLEEFNKGENMYKLENEISLHESCYNLIKRSLI